MAKIGGHVFSQILLAFATISMLNIKSNKSVAVNNCLKTHYIHKVDPRICGCSMQLLVAINQKSGMSGASKLFICVAFILNGL